MPRQAAALLLLALGLLPSIPGVTACAVSDEARRDEAGPQQDPLVRERVMERMSAMAAEARGMADKLRAVTAEGGCDGICGMAGQVCDVSGRVCDIAADYPGDEEATEHCRWPKYDCQESMVSCNNCGGLGGQQSEF